MKTTEYIDAGKQKHMVSFLIISLKSVRDGGRRDSVRGFVFFVGKM